MLRGGATDEFGARESSSRLTGVVFFAGFAGIASGSHGPTTIAFLTAVAVAWTWLTALFLAARGRVSGS